LNDGKPAYMPAFFVGAFAVMNVSARGWRSGKKEMAFASCM
jgi:hypothetical protein